MWVGAVFPPPNGPLDPCRFRGKPPYVHTHTDTVWGGGLMIIKTYLHKEDSVHTLPFRKNTSKAIMLASSGCLSLTHAWKIPNACSPLRCASWFCARHAWKCGPPICRLIGLKNPLTVSVMSCRIKHDLALASKVHKTLGKKHCQHFSNERVSVFLRFAQTLTFLKMHFSSSRAASEPKAEPAPKRKDNDGRVQLIFPPIGRCLTVLASSTAESLLTRWIWYEFWFCRFFFF